MSHQLRAKIVSPNSVATAAVVLAFLCAFAANAAITAGPEIELSNEDMMANGIFDAKKPLETGIQVTMKYQMMLVAHLRERCLSRGCQVFEVKGKWKDLAPEYRVVYPDNWYFQVSVDPGCVEITSKPGFDHDFERNKERINTDIYGAGAEMGLRVWSDGTGHFNFGARSAFGEDVEAFLRFFVDMQNHADLALGGLGYEPLNGPPLSVMDDQKQREALHEIIREVKAGRFTTITQLAQAIQDRVYTKTYQFHDSWAPHYQAVGLKKVASGNLKFQDQPVELRAMFSQPDAESFIKVIHLIEGRLAFLRKQTGPIIYNSRFADDFDFPARSLKTRFYIYVVEAGLAYEDFESLLAPGNEKVHASELASFLVEEAPLKARIGSLNMYMDLLETSEFVREKAIVLLADPRATAFTERAHILRRLQEISDRAPKVQVAVTQPSSLGRVANSLFRGLLKLPPKPVIAAMETRNWAQGILDRAGGPAASLRIRCESVLR